MYLLAQDSGFGGAVFWLIVILGVCAAMFVALGIVRKRMRSDADEGPPTGFTLGDLRDLHRAGQMSDDEFEKAKNTLIEATRSSAAKPPPADAPRRSDPQL